MTFLALILMMATNDGMKSIPSTQSSNQTGGVTAGSINTLNYLSAPPVTEQEQAIAVERLNLTLQELSTYKERPAELGDLTILESVRTERSARRLYIVLSSFFDPTIARLNVGRDLLAFKRRYNIFVRKEANYESLSTEYFGRKTGEKWSEAWKSVLFYSILRSYRGSKEATVASGMQFIGIGADQSEVLYETFVADPAGGAWLPLQVREQEALIASAVSLLKGFDQFRTTNNME